MKWTASLALAALLSGGAIAQTPETLSFENARWRIEAEHAATVTHLGREALHWRDGIVWLDGMVFDTGEIRFELALSGMPGHSGIVWRGQGPGDWEKFYFRHHLSGMPDAVQYTPAYDGVTGWQIYSGPEAMSRVTHGLERWIEVRVVVAEDSADIFMDGELIHHIPALVRERRAGGIGFWQLSPTGQASGYVRNVEVRPMTAPQIIGASPHAPARPDMLVNVWQVSDPFAETALENGYEAVRASRRHWTELEASYRGIANLAQAARISDGNTVLAETVLYADRAGEALVRFGYSDRVQVFLNGERLFVGDNGWASRDYRYLGTITRHVAVPLRLQTGENVLSFAVSETFGGWGVTAEIDTPAGVAVVE